MSKCSRCVRMWIDGKCFNIKDFAGARQKNQKHVSVRIVESVSGVNTEEILEVDTETVIATGNQGEITLATSDTTITDTVEISSKADLTLDGNGKLSLSFLLPSMYYIKLHSFEDFDIKYLSERTQTDISIPKHGQDGQLKITGDNEESIQEALAEIHSVLGAIRSRSAPLQFIAIPILSDEIKNSFDKFKEDILNDNIKGVEESIFQSRLKLHLTVVVLALFDGREKAEAINTLEEYKTKVLSPVLEKRGPLKIEVAGINCMNSNYKDTHVLYANAKILNETEDASLQKLLNYISDYFYARGLLKENKAHVKLHVTLMNTKYRKAANSPKRRWAKRQSFDARTIMEKYKDYKFGQCNFDSIQLCLMKTKGEDGFYKSLSTVNF